eukprot:Polyplicarium_translucidae@DN2867_c0_g1_i4.p1
MVTRIGWFRFKGIGWEEPTILANYTTIPFDGAWHIVPLESSWLPESETLFEEPPVVVAQVALTVAIRGVTLAEFEMRIVSLDNAPNHAEFSQFDGAPAQRSASLQWTRPRLSSNLEEPSLRGVSRWGSPLGTHPFWDFLQKSPYIMPLHFPHGGQCARPSLFASSTSGSDDANGSTLHALGLGTMPTLGVI